MVQYTMTTANHTPYCRGYCRGFFSGFWLWDIRGGAVAASRTSSGFWPHLRDQPRTGARKLRKDHPPTPKPMEEGRKKQVVSRSEVLQSPVSVYIYICRERERERPQGCESGYYGSLFQQLAPPFNVILLRPARLDILWNDGPKTSTQSPKKGTFLHILGLRL